MWVKLNCFNYEELLETITQVKEYTDTPNAFTMEELYHIFKKVTLIQERRLSFPKLVRQIGKEVMLRNSASKSIEDLHHSTGLKRLSELLTEVAQNELEPEDLPIVNLLDQDYLRSPEGIYDVEPDQVAALIDQIEDYIIGDGKEYDYADVMIEQVLFSMLSQEERNNDVKIIVLKVPGQVVQFGNSLITFPIILAEVEYFNELQ